MAKLDFPGSPSTNQKYPSPAVAGQPVYTWDGEKWTSIASQYVPGTAPFEPAMAYSGMQINGGMEISQENGATNVTGIANISKYVVDGWLVASVGTQVMAGVQNAAAPPSFSVSLQTWVTTANAAPAAGHYTMFSHSIEGARILRLAWGTASASPITLSFWVFAARAGNYSGSITNGALFNRSYVFTFTVNAVTTWEFKTVTIPGDVTGTWSKGNDKGMTIAITMMAGSTYTTASGAWTAGGYLGATGTINGVAATSDTMLITGVTVLPGTQAPTAAQSPNIMRSYDQELVICKRYLSFPLGNIHIVASGAQVIENSLYYPVEMRAAPTITLSGGAILNGTPSVAQPTQSHARFIMSSAAAGDCYAIQVIAKCDARL